MATTTFEQAFLDESREFLLRDFLPRIERCVELLTDEDIWWRAHETDNSVGNLLLHLAGNVRQWIIAGVGGAPDLRDRQTEFEERRTVTKADLVDRLRGTLEEADRVLARVDPGVLLSPRFIQFTERTPLQAIYHVVEHFSHHTGQILYITKLRTGRDLGFYRFLEKKSQSEV